MKINSGQRCVAQLFSETSVYEVPKYQRYYAWEAEEVEDFIRDLGACIDARFEGSDARQHFFGGILMVSSEQPGTSVVRREIIDGQQRLATFVLFGKVLIDSFLALEKAEEDIGKSENILKQVAELERNYIEFQKMVELEEKTFSRLTLSEADKEYFYTFIKTGEAISTRDSHTRIMKASEQIGTYVSNYLEPLDVASREKYLSAALQVLQSDLTVLELITETKEHAYMLFQVLNDRGKGLTEGELLRAATLELLEAKQHERRQSEVAKIWDDMLARSPVEIENYLRWIYASYAGVRPGAASLYDDFMNQFFPEYETHKVMGGDLDNDGANRVVDQVRELGREFSLLGRIAKGEWPYEADANTVAWSKERLRILTVELKHEYCFPLLLAASSKLEPKNFSLIVESVERFFFRYKIIGKAHMTKVANLYHSNALDIRSDVGKYQVASIIEDLRRIAVDKVPDDLFGTSLNTLEYSTTGSNKHVRYFLMTVEHYLRWFDEGARGVPQCKNPETLFDFNNTSIEHIYPQNPTREKKVAELDEVVHKLGNLTFLGQDDNAVLGNEDYDEKKKVFADSSISLNRKIDEYDEWTQKSVLQRQEMLIECAKKIFMP